MAASSTTSLAIVLHQSSNHDELFMKQTLQFSETLKDLKNLRKQLYSAADYFETCYGKEEHKETVIETLKEYAAKAVVNTVDHLGSVSDKFNSFLSDNTSNFSTAHLRLSSLEQRMKLCREYTEKNEHCFLFQSPHHHKRYFFPSIQEEEGRIEQRGTSFSDSLRFKSDLSSLKAVRATILENQPNTIARKGSKTGSFSFSENKMSNKPPTSGVTRGAKTRNDSNSLLGKRANSPMRFPLLRSGSLLKRSSSPSQPRKLEAERGTIAVSRNREIVEIKQSSVRNGKKKKKSLMLKAFTSMSKSIH